MLTMSKALRLTLDADLLFEVVSGRQNLLPAVGYVSAPLCPSLPTAGARAQAKHSAALGCSLRFYTCDVFKDALISRSLISNHPRPLSGNLYQF